MVINCYVNEHISESMLSYYLTFVRSMLILSLFGRMPDCVQSNKENAHKIQNGVYQASG